MVLESRDTREAPAPESARESVLTDYRIAYRSRQLSLIGRREVFTGKAKFGIFGDGKEVAQVALARAFRPGDFRSGYYRDQTLMMALGLLSPEEFFAQLYADADPVREPASAGRQMTCHFASRLLESDGRWRRLTERFNSSADLSPTGSQMPRLVGLAWASKLYRGLDRLADAERFSHRGNEIAFGTIGNASCAEGLFWESINAAGVLGIPMLLSIWDDDYGISVPNRYQVTKGNLSAVLRGFQRLPGSAEGFDIYTARGWDYAELSETYMSAAEVVRDEHVPAIVHVVEMTQPQGHSTSGSHERYKSPERLAWEEEHDCVVRMRSWILKQGLAEAEELEGLERQDLELVREARRRAWEEYRRPLDEARIHLLDLAGGLSGSHREVAAAADRLRRLTHAGRRDMLAAATDMLIASIAASVEERQPLLDWRRRQLELGDRLYGSDLWSETARSALRVPVVGAAYSDASPELRGFEILNAAFDAALERHPELIAFGEDVGKLGDVNQGFAGLQDKYGELRVCDTGIRESTILGQAIGVAMRGLRPLAEVQYLDYLLYALQILSDDLSTLRWRSRGGQKAPVILRTRGHRLEGVWHSGSLLAGILGLCRGLYVCVPRNMVQAAGMYNTLLRSDDPGLVIEVLNGYRLRERLPDNIGELTVPLGMPEVLRQGDDVTLVTYGACCRIALEAADLLAGIGVEVEVIDAQTLLPFDREESIRASLERTNRLVLVDEDVPGGTTAYMLQQILEAQGGYDWLDAEPVTVSGKAHRPAYGSDGDYFSKPNRETIFDAVYELMRRGAPDRFPPLTR